MRVALESSGTRDDDGFHPWNHEIKNKTRYTLVRAVVWYLEHYKDDQNCKTVMIQGVPAVELSFRFAYDLTGFYLCGHLDRIVETEGRQYVHDRKTTGYTISPE